MTLTLMGSDWQGVVRGHLKSRPRSKATARRQKSSIIGSFPKDICIGSPLSYYTDEAKDVVELKFVKNISFCQKTNKGSQYRKDEAEPNDNLQEGTQVVLCDSRASHEG